MTEPINNKARTIIPLDEPAQNHQVVLLEMKCLAEPNINSWQRVLWKLMKTTSVGKTTPCVNNPSLG